MVAVTAHGVEPGRWLSDTGHCNPREHVIKVKCPPDIPSRGKAYVDFAAFAARLKSCPFKTMVSAEVP